jgi:hypothetical protein
MRNSLMPIGQYNGLVMRKSRETTAIIFIGFALFLGWIAAASVIASFRGWTYLPENIGKMQQP